MVAPLLKSGDACLMPTLCRTSAYAAARSPTFCETFSCMSNWIVNMLPVQAASAAAAHADAMQVSAAELLAGQRRYALRRRPQTGGADTNASAAPSASATTAEAASAAPLHAPAPLVHRLPGEHPAPLYDPEALQLWLLQCCQTVRQHMHLDHARDAEASLPHVSPLTAIVPH